MADEIGGAEHGRLAASVEIKAARGDPQGWPEKEHRRRAGVSMAPYVLSPIPERVFELGYRRG